MNKAKHAILLIIFVLISIPSWADFSVVYMEGTVEYKKTIDSPWVAVSIGDTIADGCYVRTALDSFVELEKPDYVKIAMAENTLALLSFADSKTPNRITVKAGVIMNHLLGSGNSLQVRTNGMVCGVRGTEFTVMDNPENGTRVAVNEGSVYALVCDGSRTKASGELIPAGVKGVIGDDNTLNVSTIEEREKDNYYFSVFAAMEKNQFDGYVQREKALSDKFKEQDSSERALFSLKEIDDFWNYLLSNNKAYADELLKQPLKNKKGY
jgi:hypothetical protein